MPSAAAWSGAGSAARPARRRPPTRRPCGTAPARSAVPGRGRCRPARRGRWAGRGIDDGQALGLGGCRRPRPGARRPGRTGWRPPCAPRRWRRDRGPGGRTRRRCGRRRRRPPVLHTGQPPQRGLDDRTRRSALGVGDEADAAGVDLAGDRGSNAHLLPWDERDGPPWPSSGRPAVRPADERAEGAHSLRGVTGSSGATSATLRSGGRHCPKPREEDQDRVLHRHSAPA